MTKSRLAISLQSTIVSAIAGIMQNIENDSCRKSKRGKKHIWGLRDRVGTPVRSRILPDDMSCATRTRRTLTAINRAMFEFFVRIFDLNRSPNRCQAPGATPGRMLANRLPKSVPKSVPGTRCGARSDASKQSAQIGARHEWHCTPGVRAQVL